MKFQCPQRVKDNSQLLMGGSDGYNLVQEWEMQWRCFHFLVHQNCLQHVLKCPEILIQWVRGKTQESAFLISTLKNSNSAGPRPVLKKKMGQT